MPRPAALPGMKTKLDSSFARAWQQKLATWFAAHGRQLPWRETRDPYKIWLSEIILQQTRIAQGFPYYKRFVQRFPTVEALAAATEPEVMRLWQGLGYYSRARNLHAAAQQVVVAGAFPNTYAEIRKLKGVGDYTAAAIVSFAFGEPKAVVDGNVYRVLSRQFAIAEPIDTARGKKVFAALADALLDREHPGRHNQALMDFGALHCTPRAPLCHNCPFATQCLSRESNPALFPVKQHKTAVRTRHIVYIYAYAGGQTYLHRRAAGDIWQGLYEPPQLELGHKAEAAEILDSLPWLNGATLRLVAEGLRHVLTHQVLLADAYIAQLCQPVQVPGYFAVPEAQLDEYAVPRLVERIFGLVARTHNAKS